MSDELNKTLGKPTVRLKIEGVCDYLLRPITINDIAEFQNWLRENVWAATYQAKARGWVSIDDDLQNRQATLALIASKKLAYGSKAYADAGESYEGMEKWLSMLLKNEIDPATNEVVSAEEIYKIVHEHTMEVILALRENEAVST